MFDIRRIQRMEEFDWIKKLLKALDAEGYPAICAGGFPRNIGIGDWYNDIDIFVQVKNESCSDKVSKIKDNCLESTPIYHRTQLILVPCDNIVEYINESFDFTCCLVYIDKDGRVMLNGAKESLDSKVLYFVNPNQDSFVDVRSVQHCLRLIHNGWPPSFSVTKALIKTLVPVVGSITYPMWKENKGVLDAILENQLDPISRSNQPTVLIRDYMNPTEPVEDPNISTNTDDGANAPSVSVFRNSIL